MMRTGLVTVIFLALLLVGCVVYPGIGARFIAPQTVLQAFLHFDPQNFDHNVIVRLRLPRLAAALLTGASLGVAGALLQAVIRNPLGEPHILGLNAGAALAVVAASALGLAFPVGRPLLASTGGALLFLLILLLSSAGRSGLTPMKVTLCGVALSAFVSSITAAILILDEQTLLATLDSQKITVSVIQANQGKINVMHSYHSLGRVLRDAGFRFPPLIESIPEGGRMDVSAERLPELDADFVFATWRGDTGGKPQDELAAMEKVMPGWCQFLTACRSGRYVLISREEAISNSFASLGLMAAQIQSQIAGRPLPEAK